MTVCPDFLSLHEKTMALSRILLIFCLVLVSLSSVFSAKIIFLFAGGNLSHKLSVWPFVIGLAERGHHVTFYSSSPKAMQSHPNVTDIAPATLVKATASVYNVDRLQQREEGKMAEEMGKYYEISAVMCRALLFTKDDPDLVNMVENGDYDLAFVNAIFGECGTLIAARHGWKYIQFSTTSFISWFHSVHGTPWPTSYIPDLMTSMKYSDYPLGFMGRLHNLVGTYQWSYRTEWFAQTLENLMKERYDLESVPTFMEMERNASLLFYNGHHAFDFARPLSPFFIPVGGMQCMEKAGELPKDFKDFMDHADDGVVLIAFGSTIDLSIVSRHFLDLFFNMMRKFDTVKFIWRWKGELPQDAPKNLMAAEWLPQREILGHPNLRAFMTHCGMNSIIEATCFGAPLIGTPLFADQDYNAIRIEAQEVGVKLEIKGVTQERMDSVVGRILSSPKYKENMVVRSRILQDQPLNPVQTAIYWTEFVLRHNDTSSFKLMELDQPFYVRHMLDVYLALFIGAVVLPLLVMYSVIVLIRKLLH